MLAASDRCLGSPSGRLRIWCPVKTALIHCKFCLQDPHLLHSIASLRIGSAGVTRLCSASRRLSKWRDLHLLLSAGVCNCRSTSLARAALSSEPAGRRCCCLSTGQTNGRTLDRYIDPAPHAGSVNNHIAQCAIIKRGNVTGKTDGPYLLGAVLSWGHFGRGQFLLVVSLRIE